MAAKYSLLKVLSLLKCLCVLEKQSIINNGHLVFNTLQTHKVNILPDKAKLFYWRKLPAHLK